jgi:hypothetical protein
MVDQLDRRRGRIDQLKWPGGNRAMHSLNLGRVGRRDARGKHDRGRHLLWSHDPTPVAVHRTLADR